MSRVKKNFCRECANRRVRLAHSRIRGLNSNIGMQYDVIIVGAGPAGSTAGMALKDRGYKVLMIDKSIFPRDKFCGGGLSRRVIKRFPFLAESIHSIPLHDVQNVCIASPNGITAYEQRKEPIYFMIRRRDFDTMLLKRCRNNGIDVLEGQRVTRLIRKTDSIEVLVHTGQKFSGKLVIGADGVHSVIAKQSGLNPGWNADEIAIDFMEESSYQHFHLNERKTMYVFYGYNASDGYGYVFPKKDHVNIGIGFLKNFYQKSQQKPYETYKQFVGFLNKHGFVEGTPQRRNFHGFFLPLGGPLHKTFTDRVLLCGDAAGFVNAFTGEGIYYAMVSGEHAANTAMQALRYDNFRETVLSNYQKSWRGEIGQELKLSVKIQKELFARIHLVDTIVKAAKNNPPLRRALTDYTIGELDYSDLKRKVLLHFTPIYLKYKIQKFVRFIRQAK